MLASDDAVPLLINLVIMTVFGGICSALAAGRGRSAVGWFCIGFFAPCLGIILVLVLPDLRLQDAKERQLLDENRRLREIVRKDRMVSDDRHVLTERRLAAHDAALGVDTAEPVAELPPAEPAAPPLPGTAGLSGALTDLPWMYAAHGAPQGPVAFAVLRRLWHEQQIHDQTLVWTQGMPDWLPVQQVGRLRELLQLTA